MTRRWVYLSHCLGADLPAYGNGKRITVTRTRSMESGDPLNESDILLPLHFGTHIDFPRHFNAKGHGPEDYEPSFFVFRAVQLVNLESVLAGKDMITVASFSDVRFLPETELLLIRTGMGRRRREASYGTDNPAFHPDLAEFFRSRMPEIRAVGVDAVSIASRKHRDLGKEAHRKFLLESNILPVEDMDFSGLSDADIIDQVIIAPVRISDTEAAQVAVLARVEPDAPGAPPTQGNRMDSDPLEETGR